MDDLMEIDVEQGTSAWFEARRGIPTASRFGDLMTSGRGGKPSLTGQGYINELIGERITGLPSPEINTSAMQRGKDMEPDARTEYEFERDIRTRQIGFVTRCGAGASPDSYVGHDGLLEIKTTLPKKLVPLLRQGASGKLHQWQIQGQLWITQREWCDLVVYWPGMPLFVERHERDEQLIAQLAVAVEAAISDIESGVRAISEGEAPVSTQPPSPPPVSTPPAPPPPSPPADIPPPPKPPAPAPFDDAPPF